MEKDKILLSIHPDINELLKVRSKELGWGGTKTAYVRQLVSWDLSKSGEFDCLEDMDKERNETERLQLTFPLGTRKYMERRAAKSGFLNVGEYLRYLLWEDLHLGGHLKNTPADTLAERVRK